MRYLRARQRRRQRRQQHRIDSAFGKGFAFEADGFDIVFGKLADAAGGKREETEKAVIGERDTHILAEGSCRQGGIDHFVGHSIGNRTATDQEKKRFRPARQRSAPERDQAVGFDSCLDKQAQPRNPKSRRQIGLADAATACRGDAENQIGAMAGGKIRPFER